MRNVFNSGLALLCLFLGAFAILKFMQGAVEHVEDIPVSQSASGRIRLALNRTVDANGIVDLDFGDCLFDNCFGISEIIEIELVLRSVVESDSIYDLHSSSCLCFNVPNSLRFDEVGTARMRIVIAPRAAGKFAQNLSYTANDRNIYIRITGHVYSSLRLVEWNGDQYQEIFKHPFPIPIRQNGATNLALLFMTTNQEESVEFKLNIDDQVLTIETGEAIPVLTRSNLAGSLFPISIRSDSAPISRIASTKVSVSGRSDAESGSISVDLDFGVIVSCYPRAIYLSNKSDSFKEIDLRITSPSRPVATSVSGIDGILAEVRGDGKVVLRMADVLPVGDQVGSATILFDDDSRVVLNVFTSVE